ncbi:hypothetical protein [Staphylococcus saprophyticus]|uniref:hypothetical protein n=1 Tax=Staphylococcus saprophyticus TaxID=29385 RepID=UPI000990983D|nr:hypothetical protein [Staphylococcus saprophyticus]MDW4409666.1 hypothetical protein [Staphylococcus saprophyticus]OOO71696.1 hypothetical protein B0W56_04215 [Staphylococcus saprophyticus]
MKKTIVIILILLIGLAGYSYTKSSKKQMIDPLIFAKAEIGNTFYSKNNDTTYKSVQKYTNNHSSKTGITSTNNKTFRTAFSYLLIENTKTHDLYLGYFGDVINETPVSIKYTGDVKIILDKKTKLNMPKSTTLVDELDSGTKKRGYAFTKLDSQKQPKQIEIVLNKPINTYDQQNYGKNIHISLHASAN